MDQEGNLEHSTEIELLDEEAVLIVKVNLKEAEQRPDPEALRREGEHWARYFDMSVTRLCRKPPEKISDPQEMRTRRAAEDDRPYLGGRFYEEE